jgi:hypothetical protein
VLGNFVTHCSTRLSDRQSHTCWDGSCCTDDKAER